MRAQPSLFGFCLSATQAKHSGMAALTMVAGDKAMFDLLRILYHLATPCQP